MKTAVHRAALIFLLCAACGDDISPAADAAAPDAAPIAQGSEAAGALVINEIAPRPSSGPDWIELVNRSDASIDLCDYFLTDSMDRLDHYLPLGGAAPPDPCEPRMLDAGEYLVVAADDGETGAPFELGRADEVHVASWTGRVEDGFLYLLVGEAGQALARSPDRDGLFFAAAPSPGEANP
jgi:hypothetical protein